MLTCYVHAEIKCDGEPCNMTYRKASWVGDNGVVAATATTKQRAEGNARKDAKRQGFLNQGGRWLCQACRGEIETFKEPE